MTDYENNQLGNYKGITKELLKNNKNITKVLTYNIAMQLQGFKNELMGSDLRNYFIKLVLSSIICSISLIKDNQEGVISSMIISPTSMIIVELALSLCRRNFGDFKHHIAILLISVIFLFVIGFIIGKFYGASDIPGEIKKRSELVDIRTTFIFSFIIGIIIGMGTFNMDNFGIRELIGTSVTVSLVPPIINSGILFSVGPHVRERAIESFKAGIVTMIGITASIFLLRFLVNHKIIT